MKKSKLLIFFIFLFALGYSVHAQAQQKQETADDIKAKHEAYFLCTKWMRDEPQKALESCSAYLKKYPNDDARLMEFADNFVKRFSVANEKISSYLKSMPPDLFVGSSDSWTIYKPDLEKNIPIVSETEGNYKIEIKREYNSQTEEEFLNKAEGVYQNPKEIKKDLYKNWSYLAQENVDLPIGEPKWWTGFADTVLQTEVVTTSAVLYYYNFSQNLRAAKGKIKENGFSFSSTNLKYDSSIKKLAKYEHAGKMFSNVYVADMNMIWGQVCGGLCGYGWTRNKVVVLNEKGDVLEMFLDSEANRGSWVS